MKTANWGRRLVLALLCVAMILSFTACFSAEKEISNHTELGTQFMTCLLSDDFDGAYGMAKHAAGEAEFRNFWDSVQVLADGATTYEMKQIGWNINTKNGLTTRTTTHQITFDNGKEIMFRIVTRDDIEGIAGVHFSEVTEFIESTNAYVPTVQIVLLILSVLAIAFAVWMLVDCLRRKIKHKVLWCILILLNISFTVSVGESVGLQFMIGLLLQTSTIVADPSLATVSAKIVVPLGAIVYCVMRKKLALKPQETVVLSDPQEASEIGQNSESDSEN